MTKSSLSIYDLEEKEKVGLCSKELNLAAYLKDLASLYAQLSERDCFVPSPHYFSKGECIVAANFLASRGQSSNLLCYAQLFMPGSSLCQEIFLLDALAKLRSLSLEGESLTRQAREQRNQLIELCTEFISLSNHRHPCTFCPTNYTRDMQSNALQTIIQLLDYQTEQTATQAQFCAEILSAILRSEADVSSRLFKSVSSAADVTNVTLETPAGLDTSASSASPEDSADSTDPEQSASSDSNADLADDFTRLARPELDRIATAYPREVWILRNSYVGHEVDGKWREYVPAREFLDRQGLALSGLSWLLKSHQYLLSMV